MGEQLPLNELLLKFSPISRRGRAQTIPLEALRNPQHQTKRRTVVKRLQLHLLHQTQAS